MCVSDWATPRPVIHTVQSIAHLPNLLISFIVVQSARDGTLVQIAAAEAARAAPGVVVDAEAGAAAGGRAGAGVEPAAEPKTMPVFGHVQSQCTNIMSERAGRRARTRVLSHYTAPTLRPVPSPGRCWVPNSRDRQRCRACVLDTRLSAYNGHVWGTQGGWGCVRKGCMLSCLWCGWCVACTHRQTHTHTRRERERERDSLLYVFTSLLIAFPSQPTHLVCRTAGASAFGFTTCGDYVPPY